MFLLSLMTLLSTACLAQTLLWNEGWRFGLGHASDREKDFGFEGLFSKAGGTGGPTALGFAEGELRPVRLPHDWAVELPFEKSEWFNQMAHGYKAIGRDNPENSIGWYRKTFEAPKEWEGKRVIVRFDGVFRDCKVFLNGHLVGAHWSGYTGFDIDLTDFLNYGGRNALSVRCDASTAEGWFYEGAGIYRNVWLEVKEPTHLEHNSWVVRATPKGQKGEVNMMVDVANTGDKDFEGTVQLSAAGRTVDLPVTIRAGTTEQVGYSLSFDKPHLWSIEDPYLYTATFALKSEGNIIQQRDVRFGLRTFRFDKDKGFFLNDKPLKIQGMCNHQDHAGVGSAIPDELNYWRIKQLKKIGVNAYRTSHNPPTEAVLDACDELGMLVLDENRLLNSSKDQLEQMEWLIKRDRNHASVFLWSIANEEWIHGSPPAQRMAESLKKVITRLDPTRQVTYACNEPGLATGVNSVVDIRGFNYGSHQQLDDFRAKHPDRVLMGSETASTVSTRGIYANDPAKGYVSAYDRNFPSWASTAEYWWSYYGSHDYMSGGFVWTGFDYRGEPTPYQWPCINSHFGVLDTCGFPKDVSYYYKAWWGKEPVLHLFPHWNWKGREGELIEVWVLSNLKSVELFLNGTSLGAHDVPALGHLAWNVPYQSGTLKAVGVDASGKKFETVVATTGDPVGLKLTSEPAKTGTDLQVVTVQAVDAKGNPVPTANNLVQFELSGGEILGVGNGDPSCHEADVFLPSVTTVDFAPWEMRPLPGNPDEAKDPGAEGTDWAVGKLGMGTIPQNSVKVWRSTFELPNPLPGGASLTVRQLDDLGWVYLNGVLVQKTTEWDGVYTVSLKDAQPGKNTITVVVRNNGGEGGFGGIRASYPVPGEGWKRSLFNGLAQVIVRSRAGTLKAAHPGLKPASVTFK